jgi:integrase
MSRSLNVLTDTKVKKSEPRATDWKLTDGGRLYLLVRVKGSKLWQMQYDYAGKRNTLAFGVYPEVSLAEARAKRDAARAMLKEGRNPSPSARKIEESGTATTNGPTFEEVARDWYQANRAPWTPVHAAEVILSLEQFVFPPLGKLPIAAITKRLVMEKVVEPFEQRGVHEKCRRVVQRMRSVFDWAAGRGVIPDGLNPCHALALMPKPAVVPMPALTELPAVREMLKAYEATPKHPATALAMRFIALTAMRSYAVRYAQFGQMVLGDTPVWEVPGALMKGPKQSKRALTVPLSRQAVEVVRAARELAEGRFLFPGSQSVDSVMSENTLLYSLNDAGFEGVHCPHGWRSTFSTILNERHPLEDKIVDFALGHKPGGVEGKYNRAAYLDRRTELMQEYADLLFEGFPPASELLRIRRR